MAPDTTGDGGDDNDALGLGLRWSVEAPGLVAFFDPKARHRGPPGHLHGGVAATCLDECMAALGMVLDKVHTVTAKLELRYRHPVPLDGSTLRIEAWRDGDRARRVLKVHGHLLLPDGTPAVEATGLFVQTGPVRKK